MIEKERWREKQHCKKKWKEYKKFLFQEEQSWRRSVYNEGYYTDNINSDSLHQESEYQDITDDDIYEKNKKKKPNKKENWSDKALEDFLETLREDALKETNERCNKCIMFSKHLEKKKKMYVW